MREFQLWVIHPDGSAGPVMECAPSHDAAQRALAERGYRLLGATGHQRRRASTRQQRAGGRYDELFAQQLQVLVRSGIGPVESLRALSSHASGPYAELLAAIQSALETGVGLADAAASTRRFDPLLIALLRAAERSSDLDGALQRFLSHRQRMDALRQRIVTTALYPAVLMGVGALVLLFLLFHVVPRFAGIFETLHTELPWAGTLMLKWGVLVRSHMGWVAAGLAALAATIGVVFARARLRSAAVDRITRHGWLGQQARLLYLSRYYRTLASLLGGGIALPQSMSMSNALLPAHLGAAGKAALRRVTEGWAPALALSANGLSTPVAEQLLQAGQRTGQLGAMFERAADFHDTEVARNIERFMRVLEPAVMTAVGLAIGIVVVLMYLPIFELASAVQ